jgi:hypothetical protein
MAQAYALAYDNGTLPANARQIMYAARPLVLALTDGDCWKNSASFTQGILNEYLEDNPKETANWDVVYDARGHLTEPHVKNGLGLGTLEVRSYIKSWRPDINESVDFDFDELCPTKGPHHRFNFALFIEKEGFDALLERAQIARRYDLAIFSSKGMSSTAARQLVDALSGEGVTILVLHDFDLAGLTITYTLDHDTKRYQFESEPEVIDLGLRLADVKAMDLQSEPVEIKQNKDPRDKFRGFNDPIYTDENYNQDYDVSEEELNWLVEPRSYADKASGIWRGKRCELNAMTSRQFIDWLESKLEDQGVEKVIPDEETLSAAWRRARRAAQIREAIKVLDEEAEDEDADEKNLVPLNLEKRVRKLLKEQPTLSWDQALCGNRERGGIGKWKQR